MLPGFTRGATLMPGVCQGGKTGLVLVLYFGILGASLAWFIDTSMSRCVDGG